jgi:hypothetical protein
MMDPTHKASRNWFKDFGDYVTWFVVWGALFAFVQPVATTSVKGTNLWTIKFHQAIFGAGFGVVCALLFTFLQNGFNRSRTKSISWIFAIGCWAVISMIIALVTGRFA